MRIRALGAVFAALLPVAVAAQQSTWTTQAPAPAEIAPAKQLEPADGARRISATDALTAIAKGNAVLIDVRPKDAYDASHAKGAKNIPLSDVVNRMAELPKDRLIITYCTWPAEHTSARAVLDLKAKGINNAAALLGGLNAWQEAKGEMESTPPPP